MWSGILVTCLSFLLILDQTHRRLGVPMNDTAHLRLGIAEAGEAILGNRLIGLQIGNEPDQVIFLPYLSCFYPRLPPHTSLLTPRSVRFVCRFSSQSYRKSHPTPNSHQHRPTTYSPTDYSNEFGSVDAALRADSKVSVVDHKLLGPSLSGVWKPQDVWDTNFIPDHKQSLAAISMSMFVTPSTISISLYFPPFCSSYPANNCAKVFGGANATNVIDPQQIFPSYLDHTAGQKIAANYLER